MSTRPVSPSSSPPSRSSSPSKHTATLATSLTTNTNDLTPEAASKHKQEEAELCLLSNDLDAALASLNRAIYLSPDNMVLYAQRAKVYWELCDVKSAMASYRKVFSIEPNPNQQIKDDFAALLDLHGYSILVLGETPSIAIAYLTEAIRLNGLEESYWLHRCIAYIYAKSYDKALKDLDHCVCLNGNDVEYLIMRAKLHWRLHMHDKGNRDIAKAAMLAPTHVEVVEHEQRMVRESQIIYEEACRHLMLRDFKKAIECLNSATQINPEATKMFVLRASAHRELGDHDKALRDVDKAFQSLRTRVRRSQQKTAAIEAAAKRKGEKVENASWRSRLVVDAGTAASAQIQAGEDLELTEGFLRERVCVENEDHDQDEDQAEEFQKRQIPLDPRMPDFQNVCLQKNLILNEIAMHFLREKRYQEALNAMNKVIRSEEELAKWNKEPLMKPVFFLNRGDCYRGLHNEQAALADYHQCLEMGLDTRELHTRISLIHYHFGIELFNKAFFDKARLEFSRAIEQDDQVATYYVRRGDAERYLENHQEAAADYGKALQLCPEDPNIQIKIQQYANFTRIGQLKLSSNQEHDKKTETPCSASSKVVGASQSSSSSHRRVLVHHQLPATTHSAGSATILPLIKAAHGTRDALEIKKAEVLALYECRPALLSPTSIRFKPPKPPSPKPFPPSIT